MTTRITVDEIIEVFLSQKSELKMQQIKDYIFEKHKSDIGHYKDRRSFDQTIQDIVQSYCKVGNGYKDIPIFQKVERGYYTLQDFEGMDKLWKSLDS